MYLFVCLGYMTGFQVASTDSYISLCSSVNTSLLTLMNFMTPSLWGGLVSEAGKLCRGFRDCKCGSAGRGEELEGVGACSSLISGSSLTSAAIFALKLKKIILQTAV